jgi:hypothetical protein
VILGEGTALQVGSGSTVEGWITMGPASDVTKTERGCLAGVSQVVVGMLIGLVSMRVYAAYKPFIEDDDDVLAEVAQWQVSMDGCRWRLGQTTYRSTSCLVKHALLPAQVFLTLFCSLLIRSNILSSSNAFTAVLLFLINMAIFIFKFITKVRPINGL